MTYSKVTEFLNTYVEFMSQMGAISTQATLGNWRQVKDYISNLRRLLSDMHRIGGIKNDTKRKISQEIDSLRIHVDANDAQKVNVATLIIDNKLKEANENIAKWTRTPKITNLKRSIIK